MNPVARNPYKKKCGNTDIWLKNGHATSTAIQKPRLGGGGRGRMCGGTRERRFTLGTFGAARNSSLVPDT